MTIEKGSIKELILNTNGKFFTITFLKEDMSKRTMYCRLGVKKYLKGGKMSFDPLEKNMVPVYDLTKRAYRMCPLNPDKIISVKFKGKQFMPGVNGEAVEIEV